MQHLEYRRDIDGLRAIAVLSVLAFHAFPKYLPGGFVGVDIFFVISGFLISGIIFDNLEKGSFSYGEFYIRRIRRLFPALIVVLLVTLALGWLVLFPEEFKELGSHSAGAALFVANFILYYEVGYFDTLAESKPLLHLWSLGIEEQFYIFWPLTLAIFWKKKIGFLTTVITFTLISYTANFLSHYFLSAEAAFYLPINRFWELMIGGALAYIVRHRSTWWEKHLDHSQHYAAFGGLLLIGCFIVLNKDLTLIPGWALLPTLGAFLLISTPRAWLNRKILSHPTLVHVGLVSFPLYLWHWPVLSLFRIVGFDSHLQSLLALLLSYGLAVLTYEFVEKKLRHRQAPSTVMALCSLVLIVGVLGLTVMAGKLPPRNNSHSIATIEAAIDDWDFPGNLKPELHNGLETYVSKGVGENILFWGDSHIQQYAPAVAKHNEENKSQGKTAIFVTNPGCPPIPGVFEDHHRRCTAEHRERARALALSPKIDRVVIGFAAKYLVNDDRPDAGQYRYYYLDAEGKSFFDEGGINKALVSLEQLLAELALTKTVYLVIDNPSGEAFDPKSIIQGSRLTGYIEKPDRPRAAVYDHRASALRDQLTALARRTNVIVIDPIPHFCADGLCKTSLDDGTPIYKDSNHIRPFYMKNHVDYLDGILGK